MELKKVTPRVTTYVIRMDKNDEEYASCMWAKFIFDCDSGYLNINSDAGDFSYRWGFNENEDFMHLMSRINSDYLLNKIADSNVFNLEESVKEMVKTIKTYGIPNLGIKNGKQVAETINQIKEIHNCGEEYYIHKCHQIIPTIDYEEIEVIKEYPRGAITVVELFTKYIQPQIKEDICMVNIKDEQDESEIELD